MDSKKNADVTRRAVVEAAAKRFAEYGIKRTTVTSIAEQAGVDLAELKSLFKNKNHLVLAAQNLKFEQMKVEYLKNLPDAPYEDQIKFILRTRCEYVEKNSEQTLLFFRNALMGREPWSAMLDQQIWELSIEFATLFESGVRAKTIGKDTDINIAVRSLTSFYLTGIVTVGLRSKKFDAQVVWNFIEPQIDLLLDCLKA